MRLVALCFILFCGLADARADTYPKNPRVDVLHYRFAVDLHDRDDRIAATAEIDVRFASDGETALRFDLVDLDAAIGTDMTVSAVSFDGASVPFVHQDYRAHQDGHATTADFRGEMERASGRDLLAFFDQWLLQGGLVRLDGDWRYRAEAGTLTIRLTQRDAARLFAMPLQIAVYSKEGATPTITTVPLSESSHEFQIAVGQRPARVVLDPNHFVLMEASFAEERP